MIRVTVELIPKGDESRKFHLGTAEIRNRGGGRTDPRGIYSYRFSKRGLPNSSLCTGTIDGFPRKRFLAWDLLFRALRDAFGERNEERREE